MSTAPGTVSLSLVSHTNVGKTTLARTLLGRDVGEVRDAAHVTETADAHVLADTAGGDRLLLWDTPGFGDSLRLAKRLAHGGKPWGWFLTEVWDRWRDRPFWSAQRVLQHVMAECDVVLYLVNAAEAPEDAAYLNAELEVLGLLGKPVVALLNQLGAASGSEAAAAEDALVLRWQVWLRQSSVVRAVLPLDAFTHCWVQEATLWQAVVPCLPAAQQPVFARLQAAWQQRQQAVWQRATDELARRIARAALDHEPVDDEGWRGPLRTLGQAVGKALGLARQGNHGRRAEQPDVDAWRGEVGRRRGNCQIAGCNQLTAGGGRWSFDGRDDRLGTGDDRLHHGRARLHGLVEESAAAIGIGAPCGHFLQIMAGAEHGSAGRKHDGRDRRIIASRQDCLMQGADQRQCQRIARLRPVERQQADAGRRPFNHKFGTGRGRHTILHQSNSRMAPRTPLLQRFFDFGTMRLYDFDIALVLQGRRRLYGFGQFIFQLLLVGGRNALILLDVFQFLLQRFDRIGEVAGLAVEAGHDDRDVGGHVVQFGEIGETVLLSDGFQLRLKGRVWLFAGRLNLRRPSTARSALRGLMKFVTC